MQHIQRFFNSQKCNIDQNPITACPFNNFQSKDVPLIIIMNAQTKHFQSLEWNQGMQKYASVTVQKRYCSRISCSQTELSAISPHRVTESCCSPLKPAFRPAGHKTTSKHADTHHGAWRKRWIFRLSEKVDKMPVVPTPCLLCLYRKWAVVCTMAYLLSHRHPALDHAN